MPVLGQLFSAEVFGFFLVFVRLGAAAMVMPGIGETFVFSRVRLGFALGLAAIVFPLVRASLPALPPTPAEILVLFFGEFVYGILVGGLGRLMLTALHSAGTVVSFLSGLSFAQTMDPTQGSQGAIVSSFMSLLGIVLIFATGLHLQLIGALHDSYSLFPPGAPPPFEDFAQLATRTIAGSFALGLQMAAPFIVFGLTFYVGLGLLQRLIPQVQIFFIAMPLQVTLAMMLFAVALSGMMILFLDYFGTAVAHLRTPL